MAYNLREKRPVSYTEKSQFVLPRKKKTKKCDENSIPWKSSKDTMKVNSTYRYSVVIHSFALCLVAYSVMSSPY